MKTNRLTTLAGVLFATATIIGLLWLFQNASPRLAGAASPGSAPTVTGVSPTSAPNDVSTKIVITGADFVATPTVRLGNSQLIGAEWVSSTQLKATAPWGLNPGVYDVTVVNPDTQTGNLSNAFTVTGALTWTTGGPYGGEMTELALHPTMSTKIYVLANNTGLFSSDDAAANWNPVRFDSGPKHFAIDSNNPTAMYLGSDFGFFRSQDGGNTWSSISLPNLQPNSPVYPAPHPLTPGVVYAGVSAEINRNIQPGEAAGVYRSADYGATWITKTVGLTDTQVTVIAFKPHDANVMLAGTRGGNIFISNNGGESWQWAAKPSDYIGKLYFNPTNPSEVWAVRVGTGLPSITPNLYKSSLSSLSQWNPINVIPSGPPYWVNSLAFDAAGAVWAGLGNAPNGVYKSTDGGQTWTPISSAPLETTSLIFDPTNAQIIYAGTRCGKFGERLGREMIVCGVYRSVDQGLNWQETNQGLAGLAAEALAVSPANSDTVFTYNERGLLISTNGGSTWQGLGIFKYGFPWNGSRLAVDPFTPTRLYLGSSSDNIAPGSVTTPCLKIGNDDGQGWQTMSIAKPTLQNDWSGDVYAVAPHPSRPGRVLAGVTLFPPNFDYTQPKRPLGGVYASDDYGNTWRQMTVTQPISGVVQLAYDAANPNLVYAATGGPGDTDGTGLLKSTDGGENWSVITSWPTGANCPTVNSIAVHPQQANTIIAACNTGAYRSSDAGSNWTKLSNWWPILLYAPASPPMLYGGSRWGSNGLHRSPDDGQTWEQIPSLPTNASVFALAAGRDSRQVAVYVSMSGGMAGAAASRQKANSVPSSKFSQAERPMGSGVYRQVIRQSNTLLYLPLVIR